MHIDEKLSKKDNHDAVINTAKDDEDKGLK